MNCSGQPEGNALSVFTELLASNQAVCGLKFSRQQPESQTQTVNSDSERFLSTHLLLVNLIIVQKSLSVILGES